MRPATFRGLCHFGYAGACLSGKEEVRPGYLEPVWWVIGQEQPKEVGALPPAPPEYFRVAMRPWKL